MATVRCGHPRTVTAGTIPFVVVSRDVGLRLLNETIGADVCSQASPPAGAATAPTTISSVFDGWGPRLPLVHRSCRSP
jgi:hypothetical protein